MYNVITLRGTKRCEPKAVHKVSFPRQRAAVLYKTNIFMEGFFYEKDTERFYSG